MRRQAARILAQGAAVAQPIWSYARNARNPYSIQSSLAGLSLFDTRIVTLVIRTEKPLSFIGYLDRLNRSVMKGETRQC